MSTAVNRSSRVNANTTPTTLPFQTQQRKDPHRSVRYTIDMDKEQHRFLKIFAVHNEVSASIVMRSLAYLLETRIDLAQIVIDTIFLGESIKASKKAHRTVRYTIDIEGRQHTFLRLFATHNDTRVSTVVRTLLFLLETRLDLANLVVDTIFDEETINPDVVEEISPAEAEESDEDNNDDADTTETISVEEKE